MHVGGYIRNLCISPFNFAVNKATLKDKVLIF